MLSSLKKLSLGFQKMYLIYSKKQKARILHVDAENFPGVDIVQDLSQPNSLSFCDKLKGSKLFILANVLEHIPKKAHAEFLKKIYSKMKSEDGLIITVPYDYPYHADPIDTMYRPSPNELNQLLPLTWLEGEIVSAGSYKEEFKRMNVFKKIRKLLKPLWILQKPTKWLENHRLFYLFKQYQITIVFGVK
ncbi:hypothetical protein MCEMHM16_00474 [Candidatus Methylopumilus planktonicus]